MIRKKRMSKGIAKILSGLLVFGMVAGIVPAVPGQTVHAKAEGESEQNVTAAENPEHKHCVCGTGKLSVGGHNHNNEQTWKGINKLSDITGEGYYYLKDDVTIDSAWDSGGYVKLCLNGHKIIREITNSADDPKLNAVIYTTGQFVLTDCNKENGIITHKGEISGVGIYNNSVTSRFIMYNGNIFGNNGGVTNYSTFQMYGGTISGNNAMHGGGVYNYGTFDMSGGTITDNTSTEEGGGVYNEKDNFNMSGGLITGNRSQSKGGGVFLKGGTLKLSGTANIIENKVNNNKNNLYLGKGQQVSAIGQTRGVIYVTTEVKPTENSPVTITNDAASAEYFKSDNSDYEIGTGADGKVVLKTKQTIEAPAITTQPQSISVNVGDQAVFTINATGKDLKYQWQVKKSDNARFVDIEGATSESYTLTAENIDFNGYQYQCVVSNKGGSVTSNSVTLTVTEDAAPTPTPIPVPDPEPKTFTYDRTEHIGIESGENYTVVSGTNSAIDAGTYVVIIKPSAGKTWKDGTAEEKTFNWEITKASQNAPAGLVGEKPTTAGGSDGKITGVKENMEYRKSGTDSYIACTGTEITGLSAGTYEVRYKGDTNHEESPAFVVIVPDDKPVYILEIINGKGSGMYVQDFVVEITANTPETGKVFDKWKLISGEAVIADVNSAATTVTTIMALTKIEATYKDSETTPTPDPKPEPTPNPEPTTPPAPNPAPEATTPTPDPAPATSTPAASTTPAPASSSAVAPTPVTYDILDGVGSSWTQNTDGSLAIRGSGEISKFREVKVDGVTVDPVNYTVTEGSTIITFKPEYLKSLSTGNHSFELVWTDGTAATNFTVAENADQSAKSPKTGEDFSMALCTALLMVSCAGLAGIFAKRKRNHAR